MSWKPKPGDWVVVVRYGWHSYPPPPGTVVQVACVDETPRVYGWPDSHTASVWYGLVEHGADPACLRPATPEELARVRLDQLGAEDAL